MKLCDITLRSPAENLACDEALLDLCEARGAGEVLRFWKAADYFVVVGYANRVETEVNTEFCRLMHIPVLRRCSGGGTVLQGPGCLNYTAVLRIDSQPELRSITSTNRYILARQGAALSSVLHAQVQVQGHTDLALGGLKFSGNAQRRKKDFLLFHGSLLLDLDIGVVEKALAMPSKQPEYRFNRSHTDFLVNLKVNEEIVKNALAKEWGANEVVQELPLDRIEELLCEKYDNPAWNLKF